LFTDVILLSWSELQNTSQLNDEQINSHLRQTLLYSTLSHVLQKAISEHLILSPTDALPIPSAMEIAIRFPELTENGANDVAQDYNTENAWLAGLVGSNNLEGWYQRTLSLVKEELED
jgi:hypothetical protein